MTESDQSNTVHHSGSRQQANSELDPGVKEKGSLCLCEMFC